MSLYLPFNFGSRSLESKAQAFYYTGADQTFNFIGGQTYTIYAWGAAGGYNNFNGNQNFGGYGAYLTGVFSPSTSGIATVIVGRAGQGSINQVSNVGHWYGGGGAGNGIAADGGGRASIFVNTTDILTVGGGGGSGGNMAAGAAPGGNAGAAYSNGVFTSTGSKPSGNWAGYGATMSAGGKYGDGGTSSGSSGTGPAGNTGSTQIGGDGSGNAGGGGSGYYGGGGSSTDYYNGSSGGGGGSSYINTNYFSCISAAQGSSIPTSTSLSGAVKGLYNGAGYTAGTSSSSNNGHGLIIIVQNPLTFNPTYLPGCMLWLDAADVDGTGVTTTSTVLSLASFVPASPTTQEVSYSVSSQYYYSLSNWTPVSCVMNGPSVNGSQPQTANLAPSATTGIWYGYWNDGTYCKMVKLQFSITSGRIYVTALSAGYVSSASSITSSTTGTQNDTIFSSATSATVATSSTTGAYGVQSFSIKTSGLPSNGTNITTWVDKSGNGNNASPSNGSSGVIPTYSNSAVFINNGGSANYNSSTYTCLNISSNFQTGTNFSIFAVFNFTNSNGYQSIFQNQRPNGQTENRIQLGNTQTFDTDSSGNVRAITGISLGTSTSVVSYLTSQAANYMYQNSVLIGSNTTAITEVSTDGNALPSIGGGNSDSRWATGYFNEIICYNGLLTPLQQRQVEMYLAWKWNLGTPLSTFSPTSINGLNLWLDAADISTISLNTSNRVSSWTDKANGYVFTAPTQPLYSATGFNSSYPAISSTGSSEYLTSTIPISKMVSTSGTSIFMVMNISSGTTILYYPTNSSPQRLFDLEYSSTCSIYDAVKVGRGSLNLNDGTMTIGGSPLVVTLVNNPLTSSYIGRTNGNTNTFNLSANGFGSIINGSQVMQFLASGGSYPAVGSLSEVLIFNTALTTYQQQQIEGYLAWKWGLQGNLSSSHPNRYSLPTSTPFSPLLIPGCSLWLDAADTSTLVLNTSTVTQWNDKSGRGLSATSNTYTSIGLPTYNSSGTPYLQLADSQGLLVNNWGYTTGWSCFVALNTVSLNNRWLISPFNGVSNVMMGMNVGSSKIWPALLPSAGSDATGNHIENTNAVNTNTSALLSWYRDGTLQTSNTTNPGVAANSACPLGIGGNATINDARSGTYNIYEIIIYNTALTTTQQQQIEGYLAWKWGMQGNLPSTHPFYKASPGSYTIPTNILYSLPQDALSYLILDVSSKDYGTLPQPVTTNGTVTYTTIGGKKCAYFNNSLSNYLSLPFTTKTTLTLCFWLYAFDSGAYTALSITNSSFNPTLQVDLPNSTTTTIYTAMPNQWTNQPGGAYGGPGQWAHYAITINYSTYAEQLYINGSLVSSATGTGSPSIAQTIFVLGRSGDNYRAFNGYLRQFLFYPRVLSAAEVNAIYTNTA